MANYLAPHSSGIPQSTEFTATSAGVADAGKAVALNSSGVIDDTMFGAIARASRTANCGEDIAAGDRIYIDSSGDVRKAIATSEATLATGYVEESVTTGNPIKYYTDGTQTGLSGLTADTRMFLSATTPGAATATAPTAATTFVQSLGKAPSATELTFQLQVMYKN